METTREYATEQVNTYAVDLLIERPKTKIEQNKELAGSVSNQNKTHGNLRGIYLTIYFRST